MKKLLLLFVLIGATEFCHGQDLPEIIPPAPEARKMIEYGTVPVSYNTGVPNINVPLYTFSAGSLSLPISLSYHAGGVRVNDSDGLTGLKWSLTNGGGSINRTVNGRPDEDNANSISGWFNAVQQINFQTLNLTGTQKSLLKSGCGDTRPDEFNFSLPTGESGKFVFNESRIPIVVPNSENYKIDFYNDYTLASGFKITNAQGVQFIFNTTESNTSTVAGSGTNNNPCLTVAYTSSWKLDSIILPNGGETITYTYESSSFNENYLSSQWRYMGTDPVLNVVDFDLHSSNVQNTFNTKHLKKIAFKNTSLEYIYTLKSSSYPNLDKKLDKVFIKSGSSIVEEYNLTYTFTSTQRLFLDKITKVDTQGVFQDLYEFEYDRKTLLPSKGSFSVDHFGYYNGENNFELLPSGNYLHVVNGCIPTQTNGCLGVTIYNGANRELNTSNITVGNISKVIYPTKGYSEFTFEPNMALFNDSEIKWETSNDVIVENASPSGWQTHYTNTFTIQDEGFIIQDLILNNFDGPLPFGFTAPIVELVNMNGTVFYTEILNNLGDNLTANETFLDNLSLPNDTYRFQIKIYNTSNSTQSVVVKSSKEESTFYTNKYRGGLRVSAIKNYENASANPIIREFDYSNFANSNESSGKTIGVFNPYHYVDTNVQMYINYTIGGQTYTKLSSSANQSLAMSKNSAVLYENTKETFVDGANSYFVKRYFKNFGVNIPGANISSHKGTFFAPPSLEDYSNGILWKEEKMSSQNQKVSETISDYTFKTQDDKSTSGYAMACYTAAADGSGSIDCTSLEYQHFSRWFVDKTTTSTIYNFNGNIVSTSEKFYDNSNHKFPTRTLATNSKGEKLITKTYYPADVTNTSALGLSNLSTLQYNAIDRLKKDDLHMIASPVQTETYNDLDNDGVAESNELINTQRTNYIEPFTGIILPNEVQTLKGVYNATNNLLEERILFHSYYANGNIQEVSKKDGTHIVYIWGYNETSPIAKIENATYAEVSPYVVSLQNLSNADDDRTIGAAGNEGSLRGALDILRLNLPNAMVSTFTYDPLVGVTSITDPRGNVIYYHYDGFNRLEMVKDKDGNILSENQYNYKN